MHTYPSVTDFICYSWNVRMCSSIKRSFRISVKYFSLCLKKRWDLVINAMSNKWKYISVFPVVRTLQRQSPLKRFWRRPMNRRSFISVSMPEISRYREIGSSISVTHGFASLIRFLSGEFSNLRRIIRCLC